MPFFEAVVAFIGELVQAASELAAVTNVPDPPLQTVYDNNGRDQTGTPSVIGTDYEDGIKFTVVWPSAAPSTPGARPSPPPSGNLDGGPAPGGIDDGTHNGNDGALPPADGTTSPPPYGVLTTPDGTVIDPHPGLELPPIPEDEIGEFDEGQIVEPDPADWSHYPDVAKAEAGGQDPFIYQFNYQVRDEQRSEVYQAVHPVLLSAPGILVAASVPGLGLLGGAAVSAGIDVLVEQGERYIRNQPLMSDGEMLTAVGKNFIFGLAFGLAFKGAGVSLKALRKLRFEAKLVRIPISQLQMKKPWFRYQVASGEAVEYRITLRVKQSEPLMAANYPNGRWQVIQIDGWRQIDGELWAVESKWAGHDFKYSAHNGLRKGAINGDKYDAQIYQLDRYKQMLNENPTIKGVLIRCNTEELAAYFRKLATRYGDVMKVEVEEDLWSHSWLP